MRREKTWSQRLAACLVTCGLLWACGGEPESEPEQAEVEVEADEEFEQSSGPAQLPEDLPRYPGASIVAFDNETFEDGVTASFQTDDPADEVREFFDRQLPAHGWTVEVAKQLQDAYIIFANKDGLEANIDLTAKGELTEIDVSVYPFEEE